MLESRAGSKDQLLGRRIGCALLSCTDAYAARNMFQPLDIHGNRPKGGEALKARKATAIYFKQAQETVEKLREARSKNLTYLFATVLGD